MVDASMQAVLAVYWPIPAGFFALFCVAAYNFYAGLRQPVRAAVKEEKFEGMASRARA